MSFSNPEEAFKGQAVCGSPEAVHGIVMDLVGSGSPPKPHGPVLPPEIADSRHYADVPEQTLRAMR